MKYLIVSGGEVKEGFLTWIVKNGGFDVILAADAGMEALYRDHILPDIIVGDFDSVNPDTLEYFHDKEQIEVCMLNPDLVADIVARTVFPPFEIPLGAVTALVGVPFFLYLANRKEVRG